MAETARSFDSSRGASYARRPLGASGQPLKHGGGDGTSGGMERVARLEATVEAMEKRLDRFEGKLDKILDRLESTPTVAGLWGMIATVIGVGLAISGLTFVIAEWASRAP